MFTPRISAEKTTFFFASNANTSQQHAKIKYDGDGTRVAIWYRTNFFYWQRYPMEKLIEGTQNPDLAFRGEFDSELLKAGTVVEYRIFDDVADAGHNPNNGDTGPSGAVVPYREAVLMGFLEKPIKTRWPHTSKGTPGGTYYHSSIQIPGSRTHVLVQVSLSEPVKGVFDILEFAEPAAAVLGLNQESYELDVIPSEPDAPYPRKIEADARQSLVPGANYYCLIRYSNSVGDWWYEVEKFTTLQRLVTLKGDTIHIDNDGDPFSKGEASFEIAFKQGTVGSVHFYLGNDDFKVDTGQTIQLGQLNSLDSSAPPADQIQPYPKKPVEKTFGPFAVTPETQDISVELSGTEYDGIFESDEEASTWVQPAYIYYPVGPAETVTEQPAAVTASPLVTGDDFQFTLNYRYSISYV
jgi:hypothetical protein